MTEQPSKPESAEKEFSVDEFLEILRRRFSPNEDYLKHYFAPWLVRNSIRFIRVRNIADKFESMSNSWDKSTLPLYDKDLGILFLVRSSLHESLIKELYLIETKQTEGDHILTRRKISPHSWIAECKGWYVTGSDLSLIKSYKYRGNAGEQDIFMTYYNITDMCLDFEK